MNSGDMREDLLFVEDAIWILTAPTGVGVYDFAFDRFLACRRPYERPRQVHAVARVGAIADYPGLVERWLDQGVRLIHSPEEHRRASELPGWYPRIAQLTPKTLHFTGPPDARLIERELGWPIFMKGARQTNRHRKTLSVIEGPERLAWALDEYAKDAVLRWQDIVCRQYVPLRAVEAVSADRVPSSFEFRSFWWRGELVGFGRYWWEGRDYEANAKETTEAVALGRQAASLVDVPFLAVDLAQTADGRWIVIECNDGQESGYAGVSPFAMWPRIIESERRRGK
jgi:hypothetical protein